MGEEMALFGGGNQAWEHAATRKGSDQRQEAHALPAHHVDHQDNLRELPGIRVGPTPQNRHTESTCCSTSLALSLTAEPNASLREDDVQTCHSRLSTCKTARTGAHEGKPTRVSCFVGLTIFDAVSFRTHFSNCSDSFWFTSPSSSCPPQRISVSSNGRRHVSVRVRVRVRGANDKASSPHATSCILDLASR